MNKMTSLRLVITLLLILVVGSAQNFAMADQIGKTKKVKQKSVKTPKTLAQGLLKEMIKSGFELPEEFANDYRRGKLNVTKFFSAYQIQISENGNPALLIRENGDYSLCSGQNCSMWIYSQNQSGEFNLLLSTFIGNYKLVVLRQSSNGYNDLLVTQHASAVEHELTIFRFNGSSYQAQKCLTETAEEDEQGKVKYQYQEHKCN